ncbi:MAG: tetratricopeptide repeat protein, partial [Thermoanaerobaculia bacterium]
MKNLFPVLMASVVVVALAACGQQPAAEQEAAPEMAAEATEVVMVVPMTTSSDVAREHFLDGLAASDMGRGEDAREHFQLAVEADPDFALAHWGMAINAPSLEGFTNNLQKANELAEGASDAEKLLIVSLQKGFENDLEGQLELSEQLVEMLPDSPRARLTLAFAQANLGRYEDQRATAMKAIELAPEFVPAYAQLGNSYVFNEPRDFTKAEEYMRKVVELAPDEQNSYDLLGDVYRAQGNLAEARDSYTRAAELDPTNGSPLQQRGHVNSFLGNWEEARADYDAAMDLSDPDTRAGFGTWRAYVSIYEGNPEAAVAELNDLAATVDQMDIPAPRSVKINALGDVAAIAAHTGMFDVAESALERRRTLAMEQAEEVGTEEFRRNQEAAVAYFDGMLAARKGEFGNAVAKAEEYMAIVEPNANPRKNESAHEVMALAALLQDDYEGAVEHYLQTDPSDVYAKYHLALAYKGAGEDEKAQELLKEVADYNFNAVGYALVREQAV